MIRFFHIQISYNAAISQVYQQFPDLKSTNFAFQTKVILEDAFSSSHIFNPYLDKMGYETFFAVSNNPVSQAQWMRENNIQIVDKNNWVKEITARQIEQFKPDVVYCWNPTIFDSAFFRGLSHKPALVMGWRGADINGDLDWTSYDVMMSGLPIILDVAKQLGARNTEFFFPGFPAYVTQEVAAIPERYDVVFTGSWTAKQHATRNEYLMHIAQHSNDPQASYSCAFHLHLSGDNSVAPDVIKPFLHPNVFGMAMHEAMKRGRINIDARASHSHRGSRGTIDMGGKDTINMRLFEATGIGNFLLTEYFDGLKKYFEPGIEVESFKNRDELIEKIKYYLDHPAERKMIAKRGQERCLREYTMEQRAKEFDRIIKKHLRKPPVSFVHPMAQSALQDTNIAIDIASEGQTI